MYARKDGLKINFPIEIGGVNIKSLQWVQGKSEQWLDDNGVTLHDDPVMPDYDPDTQHKPVIGADGEYEQPVDMTQEEIDERYEASIPRTVTMRQARAALIITGNIGLIQPAIDAIEDDTERALAQNEWDNSGAVERDRGLVQMLGLSLFTKEQLDQLFILAAQQA